MSDEAKEVKKSAKAERAAPAVVACTRALIGAIRATVDIHGGQEPAVRAKFGKEIMLVLQELDRATK